MIQNILIAVAGLGKCEKMLKVLMESPIIKGANVTILHVVTPQVTAELMSEKLTAGGKILADAIAIAGVFRASPAAVARRANSASVARGM